MKKLAIFALTAAVIGLSAVEPHVDMKTKKRADGKTEIQRNVFFNNGQHIAVLRQ